MKIKISLSLLKENKRQGNNIGVSGKSGEWEKLSVSSSLGTSRWVIPASPYKTVSAHCLFCQYCSPPPFFFSKLPHPAHMEVPRLRVKSEPQLPAYTKPQTLGIRAVSVTCTAARGIVGSPTPWSRPGIKPASSRMLVGFFTTEPQQELHPFVNLLILLLKPLSP